MKKLMLMLVLMVMLVPSTVSAASYTAHWRHHIFVSNGTFYLIHPSGTLWFWTCNENAAGNWWCGWKK